jgi:hypothetical protein
MIVNACGKLGPRPTPKPKSIRAKKGKEGQIPVEDSSPEQAEGVESKEGVNSAPGGEQVPVTSTVAVAPPGKASPRQVRYPSTEVLDGASRISVATYAEDSGEGQAAEMFRYFEKSVRDTANLSTAEREYYDILFTYLLAAWAGRVDSTKLPTPTPSAELESFFE